MNDQQAKTCDWIVKRVQKLIHSRDEAHTFTTFHNDFGRKEFKVSTLNTAQCDDPKRSIRGSKVDLNSQINCEDMELGCDDPEPFRGQQRLTL